MRRLQRTPIKFRSRTDKQQRAPNQLGDANWQQAYNLLCWGTALLVSALMTRYDEQPAAAWLKHRLFAQKD